MHRSRKAEGALPGCISLHTACGKRQPRRHIRRMRLCSPQNTFRAWDCTRNSASTKHLFGELSVAVCKLQVVTVGDPVMPVPDGFFG